MYMCLGARGAGLGRGACVVRIFVLAVDADVLDRRVGVEGFLGAVAVVKIEVKDRDIGSGVG